MSLFEGKTGLSPAEVSKIARGVVSEADIANLVKAALIEATEESNPQARKFLQDVIFPKDADSIEDTKWKRVVFCTFDQYNEMNQLKSKVAKLEKENLELKEKLTEFDPELLEQEIENEPWDGDIDTE